MRDIIILIICGVLLVLLTVILIWWLKVGKQHFIEKRCPERLNPHKNSATEQHEDKENHQ